MTMDGERPVGFRQRLIWLVRGLDHRGLGDYFRVAQRPDHGTR
jgi:hypothetical protein